MPPQENMKTQNSALLIMIAIAVNCISTVGLAQNSPYQIELKDGSIITADVMTSDFEWTTVLPNGELRSQRIDFADLKQLSLIDEPASKRVAVVRKLLADLGSEDWNTRQTAEEKLSQKDFGGVYLRLIEGFVDHEEFEVRYRVNRILHELREPTYGEKRSTAARFDRLILRDNQTLNGEATNLNVRCRYAGTELNLSRNQVQGVRLKEKKAQATSNDSKLSIEMIHSHEPFFEEGKIKGDRTLIDFSEDLDGNEIFKKTVVDKAYVGKGIKFGMEGKGFVGISGYGFKFRPLPPAENSICVCHDTGGKFNGVMVLEFCMPGSPGIAAGVREIGMFIARVTHSRDFIVETYNADGHLLAAVEATDAQCVFAAAKSTDLIARVRILSNPYLHRVDRAVDVDYAVDNVVFTTPEPLRISTTNKTNMIVLKNGDRHKIPQLEFSGEQIVVNSKALKQSFEFNVDQVSEFHIANKSRNQSDDWLAMLADQSLIRVQPGATPSSIQFGNQKVTLSQLTAMSPTRNPLRYPQTDDFEKGKHVLVFPTCRFASSGIELAENGIGWEESSVLIEQPVQTDQESDDDSPVPEENQVSYKEPIPSDMPSIWFRRPALPDASLGSIHLIDGQQFTLGGESGFQLESVDSKGLKVKWQGELETYTWQQIRSVKFPSK